MAKRFTDTEKWKKKLLQNLPGAYKMLWFYICDDCSHAGIWEVNWKFAQIAVGEDLPININDALKYFEGKIKVFDNGEKWFIPSFIEFQYPSGLNEKNNAHASIIKILKKYDLLKNENEPLISPLQGDKDMDMVKDKEMDKDKEGKNFTSSSTALQNSNLFRQPNIPTFQKVYEYFVSEGGSHEQAKQFFDKWEGVGWFMNGSPIINPKALVSKFIQNWKQNNNGNFKSNKTSSNSLGAPGTGTSKL